MTPLVQTALRFLVNGVAVLIVATFLPGMKVDRFRDAVLFAVVVAFFNVLAWTVFGLLTIPFSVLTLGIGALIVNGIVFLVADKVDQGRDDLGLGRRHHRRRAGLAGEQRAELPAAPLTTRCRRRGPHPRPLPSALLPRLGQPL